MDIKSLMVGDWVIPHVFDSALEPSKIVGIHYNSYKGKDYVDLVDCDVWDELSLNDIEPIPLTPEFLLKNGFVEMFKGRYVCHTMTGDGHLDIRMEDLNNGRWMLAVNSWNKTTDTTSMFTVSNAKMSVHELQHYIADCKIDKQIVL